MNKRTVGALKELHAQLRHVGSFSSSDRELVEQLQSDIHELLIGSKEPSELEHHPLHARLQEAIQRFEVSHPELTGLMARVVDSLSNMGI